MYEQIQKVLYYIEQNIESSFELESLARYAGYSKYHFCRIFKLYVGESVMDYIIRLRLERAQFLVIQKSSLIDLSLDVGYKTPNGFNKAFRKTFGISPSQYKKIKTDFLQKFRGKFMQTPKIVTLSEKYIVFTREKGEYDTSSKIAWQQLSNSLNDFGKKLINSKETISLDSKEAELFGICYDDPTVTKPENIRYDAAISWSKEKIDFLSKHGFETKKIEAGTYANTTYSGDSEANLESWFSLYSWCEENGYKFRDSPSFEKYEQTNRSESHIIEIYIPIHN
jgi:AraC family transcriptional regulator